MVIESPYAAPTPEGVLRHVDYARACLLDSLEHGEAPVASHLLYTQVLDDSDQRELALARWEVWQGVAERVAVYCDLGISSGMGRGIAWADSCGIPVSYRRLRGDWS